MINLKLVRHTKTLDYTEGELFNLDPKESICDTLEDRIRNEGEAKVMHQTAIPYGKYELCVTWSNRFSRRMVLLKGVENFTGIRMHWGRTANNSSGCILVGKKEQPGQLENSFMTDKLVDLLDLHYGKGTLEII